MSALAPLDDAITVCLGIRHFPFGVISSLIVLFVFRVRKLHVRSETRLRVTIGLFPLHVGFCGPDRSIGGWRRRRAESLCVCVCVYDDGF